MEEGRGRYRLLFSVPLLVFILLIFGGAYAYTHLEGWNYLDAVYFSVSTATTLGYGDFVPQTVGGKIFTIVFAILLISLALYFFSLVGRYFISEGRRLELIKNGRIKKHRGIRRVKV